MIGWTVCSKSGFLTARLVASSTLKPARIFLFIRTALFLSARSILKLASALRPDRRFGGTMSPKPFDHEFADHTRIYSPGCPKSFSIFSSDSRQLSGLASLLLLHNSLARFPATRAGPLRDARGLGLREPRGNNGQQRNGETYGTTQKEWLNPVCSAIHSWLQPAVKATLMNVCRRWSCSSAIE